MGKKIIITESQYNTIRQMLSENAVYTNNVKRLLGFLVNNYEPAVEDKQIGAEFVKNKRVIKKVNNEMMDISELFKYLKFKNPSLNPEFIKTLIVDWYFDKIGDNLTLSKNVPLYL